jgi:long-chain acyl-CoA synthetase
LHGKLGEARQLNDAGCKVVVCLDPIYKRLEALKGRMPTVEHIIATGIQDALAFPKNLLFPLKGRRDGTYYKIPEREGVKRFTDLVARSTPTVGQADIEPTEDLAMLAYTGGTTGMSKGVMLTHFNLVANAFQTRVWMPDVQAGRENILCVMPLHHAYGVTTCLGLGTLSAATSRLPVTSGRRTGRRRPPHGRRPPRTGPWPTTGMGTA